jgi:uncharacterized protein YkwD
VLAAALLFCAGAFGGGTRAAAASACPGAKLRPSTVNLAAVDAATLCLLDRIRRAYHLSLLRHNGELGALARSQVEEMLRSDYFADDRPSGQTPLSLIASTRYPTHAVSLSIGQNIGWGTGALATPAQLVAGWMASPPHRKIILTGGYRDAAVAASAAVPAVIGADLSGATYVLELGARHFPRASR